MGVVCRVSRIGKLVFCEDLSFRAPVFEDRVHGGRVLGELLKYLGYSRDDVILYALAAGGIPVAYSAAEILGRTFDIVVVKKITYPWTTEAGFGAVSVDGTYAYDEYVAHVLLGYSKSGLERVVERVRGYVVRRTALLRGSPDYGRLEGLTAVVVDDGIATGYTMLVAARFLRKLGAKEVVAAAPTACLDGVKLVEAEVSEVVAVNVRQAPYAVADAYAEWHDVSDEEAKHILEEARRSGFFKPRLPPGNR